MKILELEQRSLEWELARKNVITGSKAKAFKPKVRGTGERAEYYDMVADDIVSEAHDLAPMDWGTKYEDVARKLYETITGNVVENAGLCLHAEYEFIGYSPDGLIRRDGKYVTTLEIKCPTTKKYVEYFLTYCAKWNNTTESYDVQTKLYGIDNVPEEYHEQVIQSFIVNEEQETLDFFIHDPSLEENNYIFTTVTRESIAKEIQEQKLVEIAGYIKYLKVKQLFTKF